MKENHADPHVVVYPMERSSSRGGALFASLHHQDVNFPLISGEFTLTLRSFRMGQKTAPIGVRDPTTSMH